MGNFLTYKEAIIQAMELLAKDDRVIFLGQNIVYPGAGIINTMERVPMSKRIEMPVCEDLQLGICIGLSLEGLIPVCIYPRMDFIILAMNQLVNHLDKITAMSLGQYKAKVIIRTQVGSTKPLNPGPQHSQDHTEALRHLLTNVTVIKLTETDEIIPAYCEALDSDKSTILIELAEK